ncbi:MAG TPA: NAD(P)-dependent oxidoreductase [Casimicrobiaceae bacterium]|nr:NAD(P)-dependent oxidoreductase [Casimicrobiaceae bacterium]
MSLPVPGVVGVGAMGMGVVRSLRRHGLPAIARDIRSEAMDEAAALGAATAASSADLARRVDVAILLVVDDRQIDDVLFGADGAAGAFRPGAIVVVSSTVDPRYVAALVPRLAPLGVSVVDAPVSGGPAKAAAGTMTMMVAGDAAARTRCAPLFERIAGPVFVVGERPGDAMTFKIVNNLLAAANLAAGAEALALARRAGIDAAKALEVIDASSGASWIVADRMARELRGDRGVRAATRILAKDVGLAAKLADEVGAHAPFAHLASDAFRRAVDAGYGDEDDAAMLRYFEGRGEG